MMFPVNLSIGDNVSETATLIGNLFQADTIEL
jgi:hypothetical protein